MQGLVESIINHEIARAVLVFIENLSPTEYKVIIAVSVFVLVLIAYRWFGFSAVVAIGVILFLAFILYSVNIKNIYEKQETKKNEHIKLIEEELDK